MLQYLRSKCVTADKNKEIQSSIFSFLYLIFSAWLYNRRCWYMLILCPNFLTGSNEMDTETSELRSLLLLLTTSHFTFHLHIKTPLKAETCCPSRPENWFSFPGLKRSIHSPTLLKKKCLPLSQKICEAFLCTFGLLSPLGLNCLMLR